MTRVEVQAVETAVPKPGASDVLAELDEAGHTIAVVSNNSGAAVAAYLHANELEDHVSLICARSDADAALLKPSPHLLQRAMQQLGATPDECVMVGDSVTDIEAAQAAGVPVIAFANKASKRERFEAARPDVIIEKMSELLPIAQ